MLRNTIFLCTGANRLLYRKSFTRLLCSHVHKSRIPSRCNLILSPCNLTHRNTLQPLWRCYCTEGNYPSHKKVTLPALSPTMELGTIISWGKNEGDKLNEGDLLAEIETDKATMGFETPEEGYLAKILIPAGTKDVPVGKLVCIIVENESEIAAFKDYKDSGTIVKPLTGADRETVAAPPPPQEPVSFTAPSITQSSVPLQPAFAGSTASASPYAKKLAADRGLDISSLGGGTGLYGGIRSSDLSGASSAAAVGVSGPSISISIPPGAPSPSTDILVTNIRGVIAKRLLQSKQTIPHYYLTVECILDDIIKLRKQFNEQLEKAGVKLSVNDFIIKASAMACRKVPDCNSSWMETVVRQYSNVDISVAVSTDKGLITPIVFAADLKGIAEINVDVKRLAQKAREGKLQPQEFQGGTFSVSNLGMFGVNNFSAIINPPQACILAVGSVEKKCVPCNKADKGFREASVLTVTLSCDHRVVDGAVGAQWLQVFKQNLEQPMAMLL